MDNAEDPGLDPKFDALGRFISTAVDLEAMVNIVVTQLGELKFVKVEAQQLGAKLETLRDVAPLLPAPTSYQLDAAVDVALELFALRHGLVHGIGMTAMDGRVKMQRIKRGTKTDPPEVVDTWYDRPKLIDAARRAIGVRRFLWQVVSDWPILLGLEPPDG